VANRPRHPKKELEEVLTRAEERSWRVTKGKKYFKLWCPKPCRHRKTVHLTPSDPNYKRNLVKFLENRTCWSSSDDE